MDKVDKVRLPCQGEGGQLLIEAQVVLVMLLIPLFTGLFLWGFREYRIAQCGYETFFQARQELILTRSDVRRSRRCGKTLETISLTSLEHLDRTNGSGVSISDWISEVTQLSEELSSFSQSSREPDSP